MLALNEPHFVTAGFFMPHRQIVHSILAGRSPSRFLLHLVTAVTAEPEKAEDEEEMK